MDGDVIRPRSDDRSAADDHGPLEKSRPKGWEGESELSTDDVGFGGTRVGMHGDKPEPAGNDQDVFGAHWERRKHTVRDSFPKMTEKDVHEVKGSKSIFIQKLMEHYRWTRDDSQQKVDMWTGGDLETIDHPGP